MNGVQPYLNFNGNCEEAVNFYKDALGAELIFMQRYGESPMAGMSDDNKVMHCTFKIGDTHVMAADNPENMPASTGTNISLAYGLNDPASAETMFNKLADGGTIVMPMQETFWAQRFGMLTDKFGVSWMFNVEKPQTDQATA